MVNETETEWMRVATLDELQQKGCVVVSGHDRPIAVFWHAGQVYAIDNRCPHMGFPLHQGTVSDGILTCHWHHARFDLSSGCTFNLFAGDVPVCPVEVREADSGAEVWVGTRFPAAETLARETRRLQEALAQNISLGIGKSVVALLQSGAAPEDIVRDGVLFGVQHRDGWASGLTILGALANLVALLPEEEQFLALYHGLSRVAGDCAGQVPHREHLPLEGTNATFDTLKRWFRYWILVRHRDAAERTLLTAIESGATPAALADLLICAATDRYYADGGHALDFVNKAFEALEIIGWQHAATVLPSVVRGLAGARGGEELNSWRHPIDLVPLLDDAFTQLPTWFQAGQGKTWSAEAELGRALLGDDPAQIVAALHAAIENGAQAAQLGKALCYAAALRIARFGTANEFGDWITALHTFTYCNALHQSLKRLGAGAHHEAVRGVFHGAMSLYLDRFLNIPPAALPGERAPLDALPGDANELRAAFLDALDTRQRVDESASAVARYLELGHPLEPLLATLSRGVLREDADFHTFQMLEAAIQQRREWGDSPEGRHILIALARYVAAHSPTQRNSLQTAEIALRLHRGETLTD